jgi:hypothetical protein
MSEHVASETRNRGNKLYANKDFALALKEYTTSVFSAPIGADGQGRDVSLGLGNRSAVHFEMGSYKECLDDIEAALMFGYPNELRWV